MKNKSFIIGCSSIFIIVFASVLITLYLFFKPIPEKNATYKEYSSSQYAKWIAIPESSSSIDTFFYGGFDTNYRFVKAVIKDSNMDLKSLADKSLAKQPRQVYSGNYTEVRNFKITLLDFYKVFGSFKDSTPAWWNKEFNRFGQCYVCFWDDGKADKNGYGYIYLLDTQENELRVFQWSQQWNDAKSNKTLFSNNN